jgi:hypothetical protein
MSITFRDAHKKGAKGWILAVALPQILLHSVPQGLGQTSPPDKVLRSVEIEITGSQQAKLRVHDRRHKLGQQQPRYRTVSAVAVTQVVFAGKRMKKQPLAFSRQDTVLIQFVHHGAPSSPARMNWT